MDSDVVINQLLLIKDITKKFVAGYLFYICPSKNEGNLRCKSLNISSIIHLNFQMKMCTEIKEICRKEKHIMFYP